MTVIFCKFMWSSNNIRLERLVKGGGINAILVAHMAYTMHLSTVGLSVADPGGGANTLKSSLNWVKFKKKAPKTPRAPPLFSDPGSATANR